MVPSAEQFLLPENLRDSENTFFSKTEPKKPQVKPEILIKNPNNFQSYLTLGIIVGFSRLWCRQTAPSPSWSTGALSVRSSCCCLPRPPTLPGRQRRSTRKTLRTSKPPETAALTNRERWVRLRSSITTYDKTLVLFEVCFYRRFRTNTGCCANLRIP